MKWSITKALFKFCTTSHLLKHIMFAHKMIYLLISIFFNFCLVHSYIPVACTNLVMTPIMKNKHDNISAISYYRPIALPTVISQYFKHYMLFMASNFLSSVDNQFGFKPPHSTDIVGLIVGDTKIRGHQNCRDRISAARLTPKNEYIVITTQR